MESGLAGRVEKEERKTKKGRQQEYGGERVGEIEHAVAVTCT
jgi:hypothetical protein